MAQEAKTMNVGLDLREEGDGFVLSVTEPNGNTINVPLTAEQVLTLAQSAPLFRARALAKYNRPEAGVSAVYSTPVVEAILNTDLLKERILLTFVAPNGAQVTYELTPHLANNLFQRLPSRILEILGKDMSEQ
jgi:hypothetical protein